MVESQHNWHGTQVSTQVVDQLLDIIFASHHGWGITNNGTGGDHNNNNNNNNGTNDYQSNDVAWFQQGIRMDMLTQESGSVSVPPSLPLLQWWWCRGDAGGKEEEEGKVENIDKGSKGAILLKCVPPSNEPSSNSHRRMTIYWNWEQQHEADVDDQAGEGDDSDGRHHGCRCSVTVLAEGTWDVVVVATQDRTSNEGDIVATFAHLQWTMEASSPSWSPSWSQYDYPPSTHIPTCWKIGHLKLLVPSSLGDVDRTACGVEYTDLTLLGTIVVTNNVHGIVNDGMSSATSTTKIPQSSTTSTVTFQPRCLLNLTIQPTNNGRRHGLNHDLATAPTTASATTTTTSVRVTRSQVGMDWWESHLDTVKLPNLILTMIAPKTMTHTTTTPTTATVIPFVSTATTTLGDILRHSVQTSYVWNSNHPISNISATRDGPSGHIQQWQQLQEQPSSSSTSQTRGWPSPQGGWDPMISVEASIAPSSSSSGLDPPGEPPRNDADSNDDTASRTGRPTISWSVGDSIAATGALVATGASIVTPLGAAVSVAAMAAKDGIVAAAQKGKEARNSSRTSDDGYRFGDVTRGTITALRERRSRRLGSDGAILGTSTRCDDDDFEPVDPETQQGPEVEAAARGGVGPSGATDDLEEQGPSTSYLRTNRHRFVGAVGGSAGAAVGLALLGGPVGILAGSIAGSVGTQTAIRRRQEQQQQQEQEGTVIEGCVSDNNNKIRNDKATQAAAGPNPDTTGESNATTKFRLGDNVRGFLAKGKEVTGREKDSRYKFGDFSRGLIASVKGRNNGNDQPDVFLS